MCLENTALIPNLEASGFSDVVDKVLADCGEIHKLNAKVKAQAKKFLLNRQQHMPQRGIINRRENSGEQNAKMMYMSGKADQSVKVDLPDTPEAAMRAGMHSCLSLKGEGALVLVGHLDHLTEPLVAMVRMTRPVVIPKTDTSYLPVKMLFIAFTPSTDLDMDHHEIGRSMATLLSNPVK